MSVIMRICFVSQAVVDFLVDSVCSRLKFAACFRAPLEGQPYLTLPTCLIWLRYVTVPQTLNRPSIIVLLYTVPPLPSTVSPLYYVTSPLQPPPPPPTAFLQPVCYRIPLLAPVSLALSG